MRIELTGFEGSFLSLKELEELIPKNRKGKAINQGQGEGQFQIDETVWGVYVGREKVYFLQYEEGSLGVPEFHELLQDIVDHLSNRFTEKLKVVGIHEGVPSV